YVSKTTNDVCVLLNRVSYIPCHTLFLIAQNLIATDRYITLEGDRYELIVRIDHIGKQGGGGHYIMFGKRERGWMKFNDSVVTHVQDPAEVYAESDECYMFMYKKCDSNEHGRDQRRGGGAPALPNTAEGTENNPIALN
ncbi:MAG: hypothetical protein SGARI_007834, partial [Bacillariaceae sp.]